MELSEGRNKMEWYVSESVPHKQHTDSKNYITEGEFGNPSKDELYCTLIISSLAQSREG